MSFKGFIQDKILQIILIMFAIATIEMFLMAYPYGNFIKIYIAVSILIAYFISILIEYVNKNGYYKKVYQVLNDLEEKYLLVEIIKNSNFEESKIMTDILGEVGKSMLENVNKYKYLQEDYKEYIEMWIHEIKIPISTCKIIIENNRNETTKKIDEEIDKIENYTEQALYYARSSVVSKDYYIKKTNLNELVNECIRKNRSVLIGEKIAVNMHNLDLTVNTDAKWLVFILNQIVQNSIKYRKKDEPSEIEIYAEEGKENISLYIKDNGMGIEQGEISRVFDKGFTGTNGRLLNKKSTGIGLYLSKKLCDKLEIGIDISSVKDKRNRIKTSFSNE